MRGPARGAFQRAHHHLLDLIIGDRARRTGPRLVVQPLEAVLQEPVAPLADRSGGDVQLARHRFVVTPSGASQHDARAGAERDR